MKKTMWLVLTLGLVAAGVWGCSKEKAPVPEAAHPEEKLVAGSVTSAMQSSAQAVLREGSTITDGVTSSVQSSTQTLLREGDAITDGVTSSVESATQGIVQTEGGPDGEVAYAEG